MKRNSLFALIICFLLGTDIVQAVSIKHSCLMNGALGGNQLSVEAPSDNPNICLDDALAEITIATEGAEEMGEVTGIPLGVNVSFSQQDQLITITGTPQTAGEFNYIIELTAPGCDPVSAEGTIVVDGPNTWEPPSSTPTVCVDTPLLNAITIATTGATGIGSLSGIPDGLEVSWSNDVITISGVPTVTGVFNYQIPLTGGCGTVSASGQITVLSNNTSIASSASPTVCLNTAIPEVTFQTTGASGIGIPTGLPTGVSAAWAANSIIISGIPAASGGFNYSIPLIGGCGSVNAIGTITVNPTNTVGAASSNPTLCVNTTLTSITHATTGASGIGIPTGLPAGVSAAWASNSITISGVPSASGTFDYSIPLTGGCGNVNATGTITVSPDNVVSSASSSPVVCINSEVQVSFGTAGATGIGSSNNLPDGVSAAWSSNVISVQGSPLESGVFEFSIPLTGGCGTIAAEGVISVSPEPNAGIINGADPHCAGINSDTLFLENSIGSIQWLYGPGIENAQPISGETSTSLIVTNLADSTVYLAVASTVGCASDSAFTLVPIGENAMVTYLPLSVEACVGWNATLYADLTYSTSWYVDGLLSNDSDSLFELSALDAGSYSIAQLSLNNSGCAIADTIDVTISPIPEQVVVEQITFGLLGFEGSTTDEISWGVTSAISGQEQEEQTGATYHYFMNFDPLNNYYWVEFTNEFGCSSRSYFNAPLGVTDLNGPSFVLFPNPATDFINIQLHQSQHDLVGYELLDAQGKLCGNGTVTRDNARIDVQMLGQGLYSLCLNSAGQRYSVRLVIR
jgi:hypothetical protein